MAVVAHFGLSRGLQDVIDRVMTVVAVNAGHLVYRVFSRMPAEANVTIVAIKALAVLFFDRRCAGRTKERNRWPFLAAANPACVCTAGSVTGLALQLAVTEWTTSVRRHGMLGAEYREYRLVVVA
jgi:hypothetical protein